MAKRIYEVLVARVRVILEHTRLSISADDEVSARAQVDQLMVDEANGVDGHHKYRYRWVKTQLGSSPVHVVHVE